MYLFLGNLSPEQFAARTGAEFTDEEIAELRSTWSQKAQLTGPEDWHIFDAPLSIAIGTVGSRAMQIFQQVNARKTLTVEVQVYLDEKWKESVAHDWKQVPPKPRQQPTEATDGDDA